MKFCSNCGESVTIKYIEEEKQSRHYCESCNTIHYKNPIVVVGCLPIWEDKILLCKRAIQPRYGYWTLPAGYLEIGETVQDGAIRETWEEANARVTNLKLYSVYNLIKVGQIYLLFLADLEDLDFSPGVESLDVKLFSIDQIPWSEIAFKPVQFTLEKYIQNNTEQDQPVYMNTGI